MEVKMAKYLRHTALLFFILSISGAAFAAVPSTALERFDYRGGLVSIKGEEVPVLALLNEISESADIHIIVLDPIESRRVTLEFTDRPLGRALRTILRHCSYAVLYFQGEPPGPGPVHESTTAELEDGLSAPELRRNKKRAHHVSDSTNPEGSRVRGVGGASAELAERGAMRLAAAEESSSFKRDRSRGLADETRDYGHQSGAASSAPGSRLKTSRSASPRAYNDGGMIESTAGVSVYSGDGDGNRAFVRDSKGAPLEVWGGDSASSPNKTPSGSRSTSSREAFLRRMIGMIEQRIASGESDRYYEKWSQKKGAQYVTHDRDLLKRYKEKLKEIP
jgi:hypothetical protein